MTNWLNIPFVQIILTAILTSVGITGIDGLSDNAVTEGITNNCARLATERVTGRLSNRIDILEETLMKKIEELDKKIEEG